MSTRIDNVAQYNFTGLLIIKLGYWRWSI